MQQIFLIALHCYLPVQSLHSIVIELYNFYRELCSKEQRVEDFDTLEKKITIIFCRFEMVFPVSFFDVMVDLTIHLATEASSCWLVHYRWMYPFESYIYIFTFSKQSL